MFLLPSSQELSSRVPPALQAAAEACAFRCAQPQAFPSKRRSFDAFDSRHGSIVEERQSHFKSNEATPPERTENEAYFLDFQRAAAAFSAISLRRSPVSAKARAAPPLG